jgi:hypothetical protein
VEGGKKKACISQSNTGASSCKMLLSSTQLVADNVNCTFLLLVVDCFALTDGHGVHHGQCKIHHRRAVKEKMKGLDIKTSLLSSTSSLEKIKFIVCHRPNKYQ